MHVGLAVADIPAADGSLPEPAYQLLAADVPPAVLDVALVHALVDHDRLLPLPPPRRRVLRRAIRVDLLHAAVRDPGTSVVVELSPVVDRHQVAVRVLVTDDACVPLPVRRLLLPEEIPLVGERPPH